MERLDIFLVRRGLVKSRIRSKELIITSGVKVNDKVIIKPSYKVSESDDVKIISKQLEYVGRGGLKLGKAIIEFNISLDNKVCVDLGASTGGFTDYMLKNGAAKVFAVDVGHGQLDSSLVNNKKVVNLEGINVKVFGIDHIHEKVDFVSADLSFISIKSALPAIKQVLNNNQFAVILIKPQFEVGKNRIGKGGIVKDKKAHISMLMELLVHIESVGFKIENLTSSPITGGDGNIEYLCCIRNCQSNNNSFLFNNDIKAFVENTFETMK
ncbi:MAG: TlyA family RNA methyltransferase [Clostridiales bacterium]|nr:TlyA family RNA methyltransferase [Clostridiales bacterium]